jgi:hypothetical protein
LSTTISNLHEKPAGHPTVRPAYNYGA